MSLYPPPPTSMMSVWSVMPDEFRMKNTRPSWGAANRPGQDLDCFLEGPSFDVHGDLWLTDIPYGRIFKISKDRKWRLVTQYDGWPNGFKFHRDGRAFITDYKRGLMRFAPGDGTVTEHVTHRRSEGFKGLNDLFFADNGTLFFTDQGQTGMHDPSGRVYALEAHTDRLTCVLATAPSPNGVVMDFEGRALLVAMTRGNAVWRVPLFEDFTTAKASIFVQLAGGISGADGLALDEQGSLYVCDAGNGCVWVFDRFGVPIHRLMSPTGGRATTNLAFGGLHNQRLFVTESDTGSVLVVDVQVPGRTMYSHTVE